MVIISLISWIKTRESRLHVSGWSIATAVSLRPWVDCGLKMAIQEPYGVKYWELDNETWRWFSKEEYAEYVKLYAEAMHSVDQPSK